MGVVDIVTKITSDFCARHIDYNQTKNAQFYMIQYISTQ